MRNFLIGCLALALSGCGSSGSEKTLKDYLPASGEITGWVEDTQKGEPGPEETTQDTVAYLWVDGAMDTFIATGGWVGLAREYYNNSDKSVSLYIYQMSSAEVAGQVYQAIADYAGVSNWEDTAFGGGESRGRFGTVFTYCYANATKGKYFVETITQPVSAVQEAKDFFKAVLLKLP